MLAFVVVVITGLLLGVVRITAIVPDRNVHGGGLPLPLALVGASLKCIICITNAAFLTTRFF